MGNQFIQHPSYPSPGVIAIKRSQLCGDPQSSPNLEYITAKESACQKHQHQKAEGLSADVNRILRSSHAPKPNLTKEETKALGELNRDSNRTILTVDKRVAMVVMDREDYIEKTNILLVQAAYRSIDRDPTNKLKAKLITIFRRIKRESGLENIYKSMYPMGCTSPKFYGLPIIHKTNIPLRPIVSSRGSVTYGVAKVLAKILQSLVGKSLHHIQSTKDFVDRVSKVNL